MRQALVLGSLLVLAALAGLGAGWAARQARDARQGDAEATRIGLAIPLQPFRLTERSGSPYGLEELRGKVWAAGFVFTTCPSVCPRLGAVMAGLQAPLRALPGGEDARLVAISVDPEHDTPEVLRAWADGFQADPTRWLFLTGERGTIWRLAEEGFKLPVAPDPGPGHPILHSQRLVLVDRRGQVRGYFDPLGDPDEANRLVEAAGQLLAEPR